MPEGHLIHRFAAEHGALLRGRAVRVSSPQGRFPEAQRLDEHVLGDVDAYGKHLFYLFERQAVVDIHLGRTGRFVTGDSGTIAWARLRIQAGRTVLHLIAPLRCDLIGETEMNELIARLGPDPLRHDADAARALDRIAESPAPIGTLLLDQSVIAGLGNVLRAEILFLVGVNPNTPGNAVPRPTLERLWRETVRVMKAARDRGSIITRGPVRSEAATRSALEKDGRFVYKQQRCGRCGTAVRSWSLGGRTAYACPRCQTA